MTSHCIWLSDFVSEHWRKPVLQLVSLINFTKNYLFTMMQNKADSVTALKILPSLRLNSLWRSEAFWFWWQLWDSSRASLQKLICLKRALSAQWQCFLSFLVWHVLRKLFKLVPGCCFWLPWFSLQTLTFCWYGSFKVCDSAKHFLAGLLLHWRWLKRHLQVRKSIWCLSAATTFKVMLTVFLT